MRPLIYNKTRGQFLADIITGLCMVMVLAAVGTLIFFLIASFYPPASVGVFNQAYAVLIVLGQVATLGIQNAVLYHIPTALKDKDQINLTLSSSLALVLVSGIFVSTALYFLSGVIAHVFASAELGAALRFLSPAVLLFAANKILLNAINGLQLMRSYAVLAAARIGLLLVFSVGFMHLRIAGEKLPLIFVYSEIVLMVVLVVFIHRCGFILWTRPDPTTGRILLRFGFRSMGVGILHELNTRVDVLMLGYYLADLAVGIYTLPAVITESVLLVMYAVRRNVDPILSRLNALNELAEMRRFTVLTLRNSFMGSVGLCIIVTAVYYLVLSIAPGLSAYKAYQHLLWVLLGGAAVWGGFVPVSGIFIQLGRPGWQSLLIVLQTSVNVMLNFALIPLFGLLGAAMGTSAALLTAIGIYWLMLSRLPHFRRENSPT